MEDPRDPGLHSEDDNSKGILHRKNVLLFNQKARTACFVVIKWCLLLFGCSLLIILGFSSWYLRLVLEEHVDSLPDLSLPQRFQNQSVTELSRKWKNGRVFMLNNGTETTVLKRYPTLDSFERVLHIQRVIEESNNGNITVPMTDFDPQERWIRFESGIPIRSESEFKAIPNVESQLKKIHRVLHSLGILHNDVKRHNFIRSVTDRDRILIIDFAMSLTPFRDLLDFNKLFVSQQEVWALYRLNCIWIERGVAWFGDESREFEQLTL